MNKFVMRGVAAVLAVTVMLIMLAGCNKGKDDEYDRPEFVYVAEVVPLPDDIGYIGNLVYLDGKVYYASSVYEYDEETMRSVDTSTIYSINIDGTDLSPLSGYKPPVELPRDVSGSTNISYFGVDRDENFWVVERYNTFTYNLPDNFDPERDERWNYYEQIDSGTSLRKLDKDGVELHAIDLSSIPGWIDDFYVESFAVDSDGNCYIYFNDWQNNKRLIYGLDSGGNKQFELTVDDWINSLICLKDGTVGFVADNYSGDYYSRILRTIDFKAKKYGDDINLPDPFGWNIYSGSGDYDVYSSDDKGLYGFTIGEEETDKLLSWIECDFIGNSIQNVTILPDGRVLCTNQQYTSIGGNAYSVSYEIVFLTKTPYSEMPVKTEITLAVAYMPQNVRNAVVKFNRESPDYRVLVYDYSEFDTEDDWNAGRTRLTAEIVSGKVPDILCVNGLSYNEYVGKGLLVDLYPYIDSDPELGRSDFVDGVLRAAEIDGKLYQAFSTFYVNTLIGHPDVVGEGMGWTVEEFKAVLDKYPNADMPLGQWLTKTSFLNASIVFSIDDFINWENSTVHFDTPEFIQLLEYANTLPDDIDWSSVNWDEEHVEESEAIATGRQIMAQMYVSEFYDLQYYKALFGGELVFKGFPNKSRNGNSLSVQDGIAITEKSKQKEGAWAFVRLLLTEENQSGSFYSWAFPTNKAAFDKKVEEAMSLEQGSMYYSDIEIGPPTLSDIDAVRDLIASANGVSGWNVDDSVWEIISESVSDYFSGVVSAEDAARVIQSRASILVSERS